MDLICFLCLLHCQADSKPPVSPGKPKLLWLREFTRANIQDMKNYCLTEHSSRTNQNETNDCSNTICPWALYCYLWEVDGTLLQLQTQEQRQNKRHHILVCRKSGYEVLAVLLFPLPLYLSQDDWRHQDGGLNTQTEEHLGFPVCTKELCLWWMGELGHQRALLPPIHVSVGSLLRQHRWNWFSECLWWQIIIFDRFLLTGSSKSSLIPFGITDLLLTLETLLTWMTLRWFPSVANPSRFFYQRLSPRPISAGIPWQSLCNSLYLLSWQSC